MSMPELMMAVLQSLRDVLGRDGFGFGQIGDGAGDFQYLNMRARRKMKRIVRAFHESETIGIQSAMLFNVLKQHIAVG